ncbi:CHAT domain-containing protein [Streptomyces phyllanthi]|uniref:CHAT domain-containing protein n=1 Tax=Streptomyces phyllanthi TaxID=1803180 RepID=A0A5N8VYK2_9ACTN|nr:CHAT domain-containing protein [Streptomyces phyllanthi]MPY39766.1 CHAT domain-containing protein [Streptomyces phyllanthi]
MLEITAICAERLRAAESASGVDEVLHILERTAETFPDGPLHHYFAFGSGVANLEAFKICRDSSYLARALAGLRRAEHDIASEFGAVLARYTLANALLTAFEAGAVEEAAVEEAIGLLSSAMRESDPRYPRRTDLVRLLAVAQSIRYRSQRGERTAAEEFRSALSQLTRQRAREARASAQWRDLANTQGWMLLISFNVEGRQDDLEEAVQVLREAADSDVAERTHVFLVEDVVPDTRRNLAEALYNRALRTHRSQDLDSAVQLLQTGLINCRPAQRPDMLQFLADASIVLYDARGDRSDLDRAVSAGELALGVLPLTSSSYTATLGWAAGLRSALHLRTGERAHIDRSVGLWREAALAAEAQQTSASEQLQALGDCLMMRLFQHPPTNPRGAWEHPAGDLPTALAAFDKAARLAPVESEERHQALHNAVLALIYYGTSIGDAAALEQACHLGEDFLHESSGSAHRKQFGLLCAKAQSALAELDGDPGAGKRALLRYLTAAEQQEVTQEAALVPDSAIVGDLALESNDWSQAVAAYLQVWLSSDQPRAESRPGHATLWAHAKRRAGTGMAYAYVRQGRLAEAFLVLEEVCSSLESLGSTAPWGTEARLVPPAPLEEVQRRLDNQQIVHLFTTVEGGAALITDRNGVRSVLLSDFDTHRVNDLSRRFQAAANEDRASMRWAGVLEETCAELWSRCLGSVAQAVDPERPVVLIPMGHLRLLPLHAAFRQDSATPAKRRYLLDEWLLSYAPSASCLTAPRSPRSSRVGMRIYGCAYETEAAPSRWLRRNDLWDGILDRASISEVLNSESCVVHFTGHGSTNPLSPLDSWINLDDGRLTVRGMLAQGIRSPLIIVSSCDSGTYGTTALSDPVPLPYSLVISGAKGCVAALWQPGDLAVRLLTTFFYEEWESRSPAEALRLAQLRLRDMTNEELITHMPELADTAPQSARSRARWARIQPFAGIGHWGAFLYAGS